MKRKTSENQLTRQEQVVLDEVSKQELIAYKISTITGKAFDLKKVREYGIQVLLIMINVCSLIHK